MCFAAYFMILHSPFSPLLPPHHSLLEYTLLIIPSAGKTNKSLGITTWNRRSLVKVQILCTSLKNAVLEVLCRRTHSMTPTLQETAKYRRTITSDASNHAFKFVVMAACLTVCLTTRPFQIFSSLEKAAA